MIYRHNKLGRRMKRDSKEPISRVWLLHGVPRTWSVEQATMAMETAFTNGELLRQSRRQGAVEYIFRGTSATANDTIAIPVETEDNDILTLWARWAPPRKNNQMMRKCHASGSWSLLPPKSPFATETVCTPVEKEASNAKTTDNKEVVNSAPATEEGGKKGKHENASNPPAKRVRAEQRVLPPGVNVQSVPGDGNCLFHAMSRGIAKITKDEPKGASELRAEVVSHLRRHEDKYIKDWCNEMPDGTIAPSYEAYLQAVAKDNVWAGVTELAALARMFDTRIIVFTLRMLDEPFVFHQKQKKHVIALVFDGMHYDLLVPDKKEYPKVLLDISAHPPTVPMRGGARSGARSTRTVWTDSSYNKTSPGKLARPATVRTSCMTQSDGEFDTVAEVASDDDVPEVRLQEFANGPMVSVCMDLRLGSVTQSLHVEMV